MKKGKHPPLKIIISHNDECIVLELESRVLLYDVVSGLPLFQKGQVLRLFLYIYSLCFDIGIDKSICCAIDYYHSLNVTVWVISALLTGNTKAGDGPNLDQPSLYFKVNHRGIWRDEKIGGEGNDWFFIKRVWGIVWLL